jgi:hypothetical protein
MSEKSREWGTNPSLAAQVRSEGYLGMTDHVHLTGRQYTAADGRSWEIACLARHGARRSGYALTSAESSALRHLAGLLSRGGARGVTWLVGEPDELRRGGIVIPIVGYADLICAPGTELRRFLLVREDGEDRAVIVGLIDRADTLGERQRRGAA